MTALLVAYDLHIETGRKVAKYIEETFSSRVQLADSAYAIWTDDEVPAQIYPRLAKLIGKDDQLYVITLRKGWDGKGPLSVDQWLDDNLPDN